MASRDFWRGFGAMLDALVARAARFGLSADFIRFGMVGTIGFCWDTGTVYALRGVLGLYFAGATGFVVAATANWALNRVWTFGNRVHEAAHRQWPKFLLVNLVGFVANRGVFFILISINAACRAQPVLAIIAGTAAGLGFNYFLSKRFVFR